MKPRSSRLSKALLMLPVLGARYCTVTDEGLTGPDRSSRCGPRQIRTPTWNPSAKGWQCDDVTKAFGDPGTDEVRYSKRS